MYTPNVICAIPVTANYRARVVEGYASVCQCSEKNLIIIVWAINRTYSYSFIRNCHVEQNNIVVNVSKDIMDYIP
jgi:hypothetical protein